MATKRQGLRDPAVTAIESTVVIAGGHTSSGQSGDIALDTTTGKLTTLGTLTAPVSEASGFTLGDTAYVAGGRDAGGHAVATVYVSIRPPVRSGPRRLAPATRGRRTCGCGKGRRVVDRRLARHGGDRHPLSLPGPRRGGPADDQSAGERDAGRNVLDVSECRSGSAFAGLLLIADRGNDRLLVMNAMQHVVWRYPSPKLPAPPFRFYYPDDAFWVHGGNAILVNEEENHTLALIAYPSGETLWSYGHPGIPGSGTGYLHQPDDVYPYPGGGLVVADAKNCRLLFFDSGEPLILMIGTTGMCHHLRNSWLQPNGDTPLPNGHLLVSELDGGWVDEVTRDRSRPVGAPAARSDHAVRSREARRGSSWWRTTRIPVASYGSTAAGRFCGGTTRRRARQGDA